MNNMTPDPAREALFYEVHQALEARLAAVLEGLRRDGEGAAELLRLSLSEAWTVTRERRPEARDYRQGGEAYVLSHTGGAPVLDGPALHDWQRHLLRTVANAVVLHVDSVLAASDALGIPGLLRDYAVRRVMEE